MPQLNSTIQHLIGDLGRIDDLKNSVEDPLVRSFALATDTVSTDTYLKGTIELRNISFGFDAISPPFIRELNLKIPSGSKLSIVGGSGSGKTTLIRLLAGLYQPSSQCDWE